MAGDAFQKIGDSMGRAITKISVKTSSSLEKSKIKMHIDSLTKEVQKMLTDVGEEVYSAWTTGGSSSQALTEKLEAVKKKKDEIAQLEIELGSIDERDNEILGKKAEVTQRVEQRPCCPGCGYEFEPGAMFCRNCGNRLQ